jgi:hypothetical protein
VASLPEGARAKALVVNNPARHKAITRFFIIYSFLMGKLLLTTVLLS